MPTAPGPLTVSALRNETDEGRFDRGLQLVPHVRDLEVAEHEASARVGDRNTYPVTIAWSRPAPRGTCTCVDYLEGSFCKHIVALGLAVIAADPSSGSGRPADDPVTDLLDAVETEELRDLVRELADHDPSVFDLLRIRAVAGGRFDAVDPDDLVRQVNDALRSRGFVDYRASFGVGRDAEAVLDQLEALLDAGAADAVEKALLRATTRLRAITLRADDSGGVIGDAGQRAVNLYARACVSGHPDPTKVARWLVKFRRDSPGWPETPLELFYPAFDAPALKTYRRGVEDWAVALAGQDRSTRFDVDRALVELADLDQDLDRAIALLSADPEHTAHADIIRRLRSADRRREALDWLDRAVRERGIASTSRTAQNPYWIEPREASDLYVEAGRPDDALAVWQQRYAKAPSPASWRDLLDFATSVDRHDELRGWAITTAEEQAGRPHSNGAALIAIHLSEGRVDEAWAAADAYGPGHAWQSLARAGGTDRAVDAARLYRGVIEAGLVQADIRVYRRVATLLVEMRKLCAAADDRLAFDAYVADLRQRFARRPLFLKALKAQRL